MSGAAVSRSDENEGLMLISATVLSLRQDTGGIMTVERLHQRVFISISVVFSPKQTSYCVSE